MFYFKEDYIAEEKLFIDENNNTYLLHLYRRIKLMLFKYLNTQKYFIVCDELKNSKIVEI